MFDGATVPVGGVTSYGADLKNRLERDVVTKSADLVDNLTSSASDKALTAKQGKVIKDMLNGLVKVVVYTKKITVAAGASLTLTRADLGMTIPSGYEVLALGGAYTGNKYVSLSAANPFSDTVMYVFNSSNAARSDITAKLIVSYIKTGFKA